MKKFDKLYNQILREQYTITAREVLYNRYGKQKADEMIAKIKERGEDSYLEKKYSLPNYSQKNLDKIIPVIFRDFSIDSNYMNYGGKGTFSPARSLNYTTYGSQVPFKSEIEVNPKYGEFSKKIERELQGDIPTAFTHHINDNIPSDILGHEVTHTLQKRYNDPNPLKPEIAAVLSELKHWYFKQTGIALDADMTDSQFNNFVNYLKQRGSFKNISYGQKIDFEKLLRTSEGKEVFKRIVKQAPMKSDAMVA